MEEAPPPGKTPRNVANGSKSFATECAKASKSKARSVFGKPQSGSRLTSGPKLHPTAKTPLWQRCASAFKPLMTV